MEREPLILGAKFKVWVFDFGDTNLITRNPQDIIDWISSEIKPLKKGEELNYRITTKIMSPTQYRKIPEWS